MFVTALFVGGFANRIFQMLACYKVAEETGRKVAWDSRQMGANPHEPTQETMQLLLELFPDTLTVSISDWRWCEEIKTKPYLYQPEIYSSAPKEQPIELVGFFQNLQWMPNKLPIVAQRIYRNTVFLHIRLGDYVGSQFDVGLQKNYYSDAIQYIKENTKETIHFLIFSDNPTKAEEIVKGLPCKDSYTMSSAKRSLDVLREMAACCGGVCSNSSLSFLGAFFQQSHRGIVTVPKVWRMPNMVGPPIPWAIVIDN